MSTRSNLILFGGAVLAYVYLHARNILNRLAYKIGDVQVMSISREEIKLNLNLLINNPTSIRAQVGKFVANVYINNQQVGVVDYPVNRYIVPGVNNITVGITLNHNSVGNILWQQIQSGNIYNMSFDVDGTLSIDNRPIRLSAHFIMQDFWK